MRAFLTFLTALLMFGIIASYGYVLYRDREQVKDFSSKLGSRVEACDQVYDNSTAEFIAIHNWLKENQEGWQEYFLTLPAGQFVKGENLSFIIADDWVVAESSEGSYSLRSDTYSIEIKCE